MRILSRIQNFFSGYWKKQEAVAAVEAAFVFPILLVLMLGTLDMGRGIMCNQKTIKASQVVADLLTRHISVTDGDINEAVQAATLSLLPYDTSNLGFDIVSYRFLADGTVDQIWRETRNMDPVQNAAQRVAPIADPGKGVVMVAAQYRYEPIFSGFVVNAIPMMEFSFARGRRSEFVCKQGAAGCSS
jgi:hypothetical protein